MRGQLKFRLTLLKVHTLNQHRHRIQLPQFQMLQMAHIKMFMVTQFQDHMSQTQFPSVHLLNVEMDHTVSVRVEVEPVHIMEGYRNGCRDI